MSIQHQVITYRLNSDGTIPDYVNTGFEYSGSYSVADSTHTSPQDWIMLCLTRYTLSDPLPETVNQVFLSKQELYDYMSEILKDILIPNLEDPDQSPTPIDIDLHVNNIWNYYESVNNILP